MKNFVFLIIGMLFTNCSVFYEKDEVLPNAKPYTGNQLRTNGYYYLITPSDNVIYKPLVLYTNGVLLFTILGSGGNTLEEMDNIIRKLYIQDTQYSKDKYNWGVFFINGNNTIKIHILSHFYPHRESVYEGVILNDTTFHITKSSNGNRNDMYHFRQFSPKPDSTNVFIK